jgi:dGTPase
MNWQQLYSPVRTGGGPRRRGGEASEARTSFLRDYDRIIFSSAFRRLQNKTQVFPLPGPVFVHNRLTHSLEVASVGRSLGKAVGDALSEQYPGYGEEFREFYRYELSSVIGAACLAHDIGNPPFGHSGEDAIRIFFREGLRGEAKNRFENELHLNRQRDFLYFEGNANAFRTLTHAFNEPSPGGFRLTYATLASIVKYPSDSLNGFDKGRLITKKSGFFDSEIPVYRLVADELGIPCPEPGKDVFLRHPFVYLVEAADDICYRIIDFEDAHRLNIISIDTIRDLFLSFFDGETGYDARDRVEEVFRGIRDNNQKVQFLRAKLINLLIRRVRDVFMEKEADLLEGAVSRPLIDFLPGREASLIRTIDAYSVEHIYNHRSVVEIEIAGYHVIGGLLREFVDAILNPRSAKSFKLLQLIPEQFVISGESGSLYTDLQSVVDFIAGMTDLYAVDIYRKITGMEFPRVG